MPIALYHGPASFKKQDLLTKLATEHKNTAILLIPDSSFIPYYQEKLPGTPVMTWENFLHNNVQEDSHVFLMHFYPFSSDQLEILAKLKTTQPKLNLTIFYDEHFDQENKTLQKTYEELGHLSDVSEYIESQPSDPHTVLEFPNPFDEMYHVIEDIKKYSTSLEAVPVAILAPAEVYHEPLTRILYRQKMPNVLLITDFSKWGAALNHRVYLLGMCVENFSLVLIEKTKQLMAFNPNIFITTSETDFKNKPTTLFKKNILNTETQRAQSSTIQTGKKTQTNRDYFKTKKKNFSVSEIQEYLNCPYRYYATYHLGLESLDIEDLEPGKDIQGSFVHQVLYRLIKENESDYLEGLEYASYRKKLEQKLLQIIHEELDKNDKIKSFNKNLTGFYAHRVYKTITELIEIEAKNFKEGLKKTTPKHCEWSFGNSEKDSLKLETEVGTIHLKGRIDRVDVHHTSRSFSVIDYKTGNLPALAEIKSAQSVQLPLYLMAAKILLFPAYQPAGAYFYALKENDIKGFTVADSADAKLLSKQANLNLETWQELEIKTKEQVNHAVTNIFKGNFDPKPRDESLCSFCDYRRICGIRNLS